MIPPSGWVAPLGAPIAFFPIPTPLVARYYEGDGPIVRDEESVNVVLHSTPGTSCTAYVGLNAAGRRVLDVQLQVDAAYAVVLLDRLAIPALGWRGRAAPPTPWASSSCAATPISSPPLPSPTAWSSHG